MNNPSSGLLYWLEDQAILQAMKKKLGSIDHHTSSSSSSSSSDGSDSWSDVKQLIIADVLSSRDNG